MKLTTCLVMQLGIGSNTNQLWPVPIYGSGIAMVSCGDVSLVVDVACLCVRADI